MDIFKTKHTTSELSKYLTRNLPSPSYVLRVIISISCLLTNGRDYFLSWTQFKKSFCKHRLF